MQKVAKIFGMEKKVELATKVSTSPVRIEP
jgi:hypothetical protein